MYDTVKDIAFMFWIKCSKYPKEALTKEFCDKLFDEALSEYRTMHRINALSCEIQCADSLVGEVSRDG